VIKGHYTAIYISVFLHVLLFVVLFSLPPSQPIKTIIAKEKPAIKSYIYRPKKIIKKIPSINKAELPLIITPIQETTAKQNNAPTEPVATAKIDIKPLETKELPVEMSNRISDKKLPSVMPKAKPLPTSTAPSSALKSLTNLRNTINKQLTNDIFKEQTKTRSTSIMHDNPEAVPHSEVSLTVEEKHELTTSKSHARSITKNDDGTCTIVREQILGSPVEASVSGFACGESKFDKSFREHMEKVNKKFVTYKK
jgi:hypothetical protein